MALLLVAVVPISTPAASERVTARVEIGFGSVEDVALLLAVVVPISNPAASERVTAMFELGFGSVLLSWIRLMMLWIRGMSTLWSLVLF